MPRISIENRIRLERNQKRKERNGEKENEERESKRSKENIIGEH